MLATDPPCTEANLFTHYHHVDNPKELWFGRSKTITDERGITIQKIWEEAMTAPTGATCMFPRHWKTLWPLPLEDVSMEEVLRQATAKFGGTFERWISVQFKGAVIPRERSGRTSGGRSRRTWTCGMWCQAWVWTLRVPVLIGH